MTASSLVSETEPGLLICLFNQFILELEILYRDEFFIVINKPHGLLVHKSPIANDAKEFAIQILRDQIGQKVYPAHRLDRKTSGILLFSLDKESDSRIQKLFDEQKISKKYLSIVRGFTPENEVIDYDLVREEDQKVQNAITEYKTLKKFEIPLKNGKFETARYSLVEVNPKTGRFHQIRKHFAHIFHPIIGDRPHGCNKQNKLWKEKYEMMTMMLHASELTFTHPFTGDIVNIKATPSNEFERVLSILSIKK